MLREQLHLITDVGVMKPLIKAVLPAAAAGDPLLPRPEAGAGAHRLSKLLAAVLAVKSFHDKMLITLAFAGDFVQRLWFSYLRVRNGCG